MASVTSAFRLALEIYGIQPQANRTRNHLSFWNQANNKYVRRRNQVTSSCLNCNNKIIQKNSKTGSSEGTLKWNSQQSLWWLDFFHSEHFSNFNSKTYHLRDQPGSLTEAGDSPRCQSTGRREPKQRRAMPQKINRRSTGQELSGP